MTQSVVKALKWTALIAVLVLLLVATILYLRRDWAARSLANSFLRNQDLVVTSLSVDTLATDRLELSRLLVESGTGATYEVFGLILPLRTAGGEISAERIDVTFSDSSTARSTLSQSLQTILDLPARRPDTRATVGQINLPALPALSNAVWVADEQDQRLSFDLEAFTVEANLEQSTAPHRRLALQVIDSDSVTALSTVLQVAEIDDRFELTGDATIQSGKWLPFLQSLGRAGGGLPTVEAEFHGPVKIALDELEPGSASLEAQLAIRETLTANYVSDAGDAAELQVSKVDGLTIAFDYPSLEWLAAAEKVAARVTAAGFSALPMRIDNIECRAGSGCKLRTSVEAEGIDWNGYRVESVRLSLPLDVRVGEQTRIGVGAQISARVDGISFADGSVAAVSIEEFSGTQVTLGNGGWQTRIANLAVSAAGIDVAGVQIPALPVSFAATEIRRSGDIVDTRATLQAGSTASWKGLTQMLPGAEATVSMDGTKLISAIQLSDPDDSLAADIDVQLDLDEQTGSLTVRDGRLSFDRRHLSDHFIDWTESWDIVGGRWSGALEVEWQDGDGAVSYSGSTTGALKGLAGMYDDYAFVGLGSKLAATLNSDSGIETLPSSVSIELLDVGLPLTQISADYAVDLATRSVEVQNMSLAALGGRFTADPFRYSANSEENAVMLHAESVQLQLMVDLAEFEGIEMTGAVSGVMPVKISGEKITVDSGKLTSDAPGGVIRYQSDDATVDSAAPDSGLGVVTRTLRNFEFDLLTSDVDYSEDGDLKLQMRLSGVNPDVDATQPIILNLGVENNVPQLLRSLRAIRSIEDILEDRTLN